jgi:hypothetical protein
VYGRYFQRVVDVEIGQQARHAFGEHGLPTPGGPWKSM